jgi:acyl carrier protein
LEELTMTTHQTKPAALLDELRGIITQGAGVAPDVLATADDTTLEELGLDSLATMEVRAIVESRLAVTIPEESGEFTVRQLADYLATELGVGS